MNLAATIINSYDAYISCAYVVYKNKISAIIEYAKYYIYTVL
jgi:hypothetical protein